jgi:hypothetical protein
MDGDLADLADVVLLGRVVLVGHLQLAGADQAAVAPGQAHGLAAGGVDQADDVLLHLAGQHPLDHFHRLFVGDAHALDEGALLADLGQRLVDLRAAAVHHDGVHAHQLEQHHVLGKVLLQRRVGHRVAAVLDDQRLAVELADVGQRLGQDLGLVARGDVGLRFAERTQGLEQLVVECRLVPADCVEHGQQRHRSRIQPTVSTARQYLV